MTARFPVAMTLAALVALANAGTLAAKPLVGQYNCFVYEGNPPAPKPVGSFLIQADNGYRVPDQGITGKYSFDDKKKLITWGGGSPFGFDVAGVEQPDRYGPPRLRLYPKSADVGNAWKAAVCYFQAVGKSTGATAPAASDLTTSYAIGAKVFVLYQSELLPAVITGVDAGRYSVRYEPNRYGFINDSTVSPARLKPRS